MLLYLYLPNSIVLVGLFWKPLQLICNILCYLSNEFDLLQSAIYLFIFRNHFVSKFVYSGVMKANLKYGHFLDLHGSLKKISLYGKVIHDETPYWIACFTFFKSSSLAPETKTWKLNEYLAVGLFNAVSPFNATFICLSHFEDHFFFFKNY